MTVDNQHPAIEFRKIALQNIQKQAKRMTDRSKTKFKKPVGDCVAVAVPEFDRGRCDPPNIVGIILDISEDSKFKIGTRSGILSTRLEIVAEPIQCRVIF